MLEKKFLGAIVGVLALIIVPSVALAQSDEVTIQLENLTQELEELDTTYEDYYYDDSYTTTDEEYDYTWDYDTYESWDDLYDYSDEAAAAGALGIFASIFSVIGLVFIIPMVLVTYVYTSIAYMAIAKKLNVANSWFAWVPLLRSILKFQIAGMSPWMVLLLVVPIANIIVYVMALMKTCEKRGLDKMLGLLGLIPVANFVLIGILAWKKDKAPVQVQPKPEVTPTATV